MEMSEFRFALDALWNLIVRKKLFLFRFCELISRDIHEQLTCVGSQSVIQKPFGYCEVTWHGTHLKCPMVTDP
jgi:hypothetical protein